MNRSFDRGRAVILSKSLISRRLWQNTRERPIAHLRTFANDDTDGRKVDVRQQWIGRARSGIPDVILSKGYVLSTARAIIQTPCNGAVICIISWHCTLFSLATAVGSAATHATSPALRSINQTYVAIDTTSLGKGRRRLMFLRSIGNCRGIDSAEIVIDRNAMKKKTKRARATSVGHRYLHRFARNRGAVRRET